MGTNPLDNDFPIVDGKLTLTVSSLPGTSLKELLDSYNGSQPLVISDAQKQSTQSSATVTGTASLMNVPSLPVSAVFDLDSSGTLALMLRFSLIGPTPGPNPWRFSQSFPQLPYAPWTWTGDDGQPQSDFLDTLTLSNASFILTTKQNSTDDVMGVPLAFGLNFVAQLKPKSLIGLFGTLLGADPEMTLYGTISMPSLTQTSPPLPALPVFTYPWQTSWQVPGIQLQVDLGIDFNIGDSPLKFHETTLRIYSPVSADWLKANRTYVPVTAVTGQLEIPSTGASAGLTARMLPGFPGMKLTGLVENVSLASLARLTDLANGDDLFGFLPDDLKHYGEELGGISLQEIGISFTDSLSPDSIAIGIGMPNVQLTALPDFKVSSISCYFVISQPFSRNRSVFVTIAGRLDVVGTAFDVSIEMPDMIARASLLEASLSLNSLLTWLKLPAPTNLTIDMMEMTLAPGQGYVFNALLAEDPPWKLDLGPTPLVISEVQLASSKDADGTVQATFTGSVELGGDLFLDMRYDLPGDFIIRAEVPTIKLSQLIARLDEIGLPLPSSFDIDCQQTWILIQKQGNDLTFTAATHIDGLGLLAFTAQKQQKWGFAAGLDLDAQNLAAIPGLEVLAPFQSFVGLGDTMLVVSSLSDPGFSFPDMTHFNAPPLGNKSIRLPPQASGLTRGLNLYAQLSTTKSQGFQALAKYLGVKLDGSVGLALAVSCPDPATNTKFFLSVSEEIQPGTTLTGMLGALLQGSDVGVFLSGDVRTTVQGQPMAFDVTAVVLPDGVLISGSMTGLPIRFDPLPVQLSNLGLVIGLDWEGIPSLGIAGTLDVSDFNSSLALFFDSADPAKSLVAGALSDLTLLNVAKTFAGQSAIPAGLDGVLGLVAVKGLKAFTMSATLGDALDSRNLGAIASAFQQYGSTTIPNTSNSILLEINTRGSVWHLTDLSSMTHYSLSRAGDQIAVNLEAQVYCAPQDTYIGAILFPQGFHVDAEIDYFLLQGQLKVLISPTQGIAADVTITPIIIYSQDFFSVSRSSGQSSQSGPLLSLATFHQLGQQDPNLRDPHFLVSGDLRVLGLDLLSIYVAISAQGLQFNFTGRPYPYLQLNFTGSFDSLTNLEINGGLVVGLDRGLDLGPRGHLNVQVDVQGTLDIGYKSGGAHASFQGSFDYQGIHCAIPTLNLDVSDQALVHIADTLWAQVEDIINKLVANADVWLTWLHNGVIQGAGQTAGEVGKILADDYHLSANEIATKTRQTLGYNAQAVAEALKGAGTAANDAARILESMGYQTAEITSAMQTVFPNTHVNVNLGHTDISLGRHLDVPAVHLDTPTTHISTVGHLDTPASHLDTVQHLDVPAVRTDFNTLFGHVDEVITPHGDTNPHVDQVTTPHGDTNPHVDQVITQHSDSITTPHVDSQTPLHQDTSTHIDT